MKINKIRIKNFYSYKDQEIDLDNYKNELVVIKGKNGSGKSTIFEAIIWGLFGKTIRKSTEDAIINSIAKKGCEVELSMDNGKVRILRGKKPNKLIFEVDGKQLTRDTATATQKVINDYYNIEYKTFMASMVFGQHSDIDFLNVSADDKRTIIRNFLALDDIFAMRDLIRKFKSDYSQGVKVQDALIKDYESSLKEIEDKLKKIEDSKNNYRFETWWSDWTLEEILKEEKQYNDRKVKINSIEIKMDSIEYQIRDLKDLIKHGVRKYEEKCRACGSLSVREITKEQVDKWAKELHELEQDYTSLVEELSTEKNLLTPPVISSNELNEFNDFSKLVLEQDFLKEQLTDLTTKLYECNEIKNENSANYNIMRFWEKAFSEQGLIKYVIKNILPYFNSKCNYYLSYLTKGNFIIEFDESLTESIMIDGQQVRYYSLSGGEKRKIQFSVLLALKSLLNLTGREESKLLFVDEVAENLDQEGLEGLWNLLQELKKSKTVFLITHDKYLKTLFDSCKRISVVKENNISAIV